MSEVLARRAGEDDPQPSGPEAQAAELAGLRAQRTATSGILKLISSSGQDLRPILAAVIENASRLVEADGGALYQPVGGRLRAVATYGIPAEVRDLLAREPPRPGPGTLAGRVAMTLRPVHIPDVLADPDYRWAAVQKAAGLRALLGVPMLRDGALVLIIGMHRTRPRPFTQRDIELVSGFGDQAVIAVENAGLLTDLRRRTGELARTVGELEALMEVSLAVTSTLDLDSVLETIVSRVVRLTGSGGGVLWELEERRAELRVRATHAIEPELSELLRETAIRVGEGAVGEAVQRARPVQVPDLRADTGLGTLLRPRGVLTRSGFRSLLAVPLVLGDRQAVGGLTVWRREAGGWPEDLVKLVRSFASTSALAIRNARLYQEVEAHSARLVAVSRDKERLYGLATALQEPMSLRERLGRVLETAIEVVGIERAYVWAVTPDQTGFVNLAGAGFTDEESQGLDGIEIPFLDAGLMHRCYAAQTPVLVDPLHPLPPELRLKPPYSEIKAIRTRALVVVPLIARGRTVGVIAADNKPSGQPILPASIELLAFFASHAAIAIDNARMFEDLETQRRQLELATRHKSQFLANMSHELRTPLNAVLGYTELIADGIYGEVPPRVLEVLERVDKSGHHLLGLINDVLDLSRMEAGRLTLQIEDYSLVEVVRAVCAASESLALEKNLRLRVIAGADLPAGRGDQRRLRQVLLNLVGNAIKFTDAGEITVRATAEAGWFRVSVADTGPGIPAEAQDGIFREFEQADSSITKAKGGSGLGLPIARRIVELHGGRMWVASRPNDGATFHFALPVRADQQPGPA